jgi:hypothetical protein
MTSKVRLIAISYLNRNFLNEPNFHKNDLIMLIKSIMRIKVQTIITMTKTIVLPSSRGPLW